jgi:hypothetical protein
MILPGFRHNGDPGFKISRIDALTGSRKSATIFGPAG